MGVHENLSLTVKMRRGAQAESFNRAARRLWRSYADHVNMFRGRSGATRRKAKVRAVDDNSDAAHNRRAWDAQSDAYQARHGAQLAAHPMAWGTWSLPESELDLLGPVAGRDVLEYGCGAAQWSIALARVGARVTGLDNSERQLAHARAAAAAAGVELALVHAAAEATPFADASFDIVFCDHGAISFAPPELTIPEIGRLLRPGGLVAFSVEHPLHAVSCNGDELPSRGLYASYFDLDRYVEPGGGAVSHCRPVSTYIALLLDGGLSIERFLEPRPGVHATTTYDQYVALEWARDYPAELMIRARKRSTL